MTKTKAHQPRRARFGPFWHQEWTQDARVNSRQGNRDCKAAGLHRIDNDFGLSADGRWCNGHGYPSTVWFPHGKSFRDYTWAALGQLTHDGQHLRNGHQALADAHDFGEDVEFEVKFIKRVTDEQLERAFHNLAVAAEQVYGDRWRRHVVVKVLTDLAGGETYALRVLAAAKTSSFTTLLLVRGTARYKSYAGCDQVDFIRGSLNPKVR